MNDLPSTDTAAGPSRRTTLKKGLAVGGAALWAVPAVQAMGVTAAHAEATSGAPGGGPVDPPPPPPPPTGMYIARGFVLVRCEGQLYSVTINRTGQLGFSSGADLAYLRELGYRPFTQSPALLARFVGGLTTYQNEFALTITVPDGCVIEEGIAVSFDPTFDNTPGGRPDGSDSFGPASIVGKVVYFRASDDDD
ncbi:hypothetical protein [Jannaschia sp. R86511]|uniref:hypothetical protein n=1 Tax=Jannaschia sp. R86511 TaxID=3093853 RepID=UPI0036D23D81